MQRKREISKHNITKIKKQMELVGSMQNIYAPYAQTNKNGRTLCKTSTRLEVSSSIKSSISKSFIKELLYT